MRRSILPALALTGLATAQTISLQSSIGLYLPTGTQVPSGLPTPTGRALLVTDGADGDVFAFLSSDLRSQVSQALESDCGDASPAGKSKCQESIVLVLQNTDVDLQPRVLGTLVGVGVLAIAAIAAILGENHYLGNTPLPSIVHLDSGTFNALSSAGSAYPTSIVVEESGGPNTITIAPLITAATGTVPAVLTLTAPISGHSAGDVEITLTSDLASRIEELLSRTDSCPAGSKMKRALNLPCILDSAQTLMLNAQSGYALHDLAFVAGEFPVFLDLATQDAMNEAVQLAQDLAPNYGLDQIAAANLGGISFGLSYNFHNGLPVAVDNYFDQTKLIKSATTRKTISVCPATPIICQDAECQAPEFTQMTCVRTPISGCSCTNQATRTDPEYYDITAGIIQASLLNQLILGLGTLPTPPACGTPQRCDLGGCNGTFVDNQAHCTANFTGCVCLPVAQTPGFNCGAPQTCELNMCGGTFTNGKATCQNAFAGCQCNPSSKTPGFSCGSPQYCELNGCEGTYSSSAKQATCQTHFAGCVCRPTSKTPGFSCGSPQYCELNGCGGTYSSSTKQATCQNNFQGCGCRPTSKTPGFSCGAPQYCELNGCGGTFSSSTNSAKCQNNFEGCICRPTSQTPGFSCGAPQSCSTNDCDGRTSDGLATCTNAFKGCKCIAPPTCGPIGPCSFAPCSGTTSQGNTEGHCTKSDPAGCLCQASASTPGFCGATSSCDLNGCAGTVPAGAQFGTCTAGPQNGCRCITSQAPPPPPPPSGPPSCTGSPFAAASVGSCMTSNVAPRADCGSALLAQLPNHGDFLDASDCDSAHKGTNPSGQLWCNYATNGGCALVVVFSDSGAQQQRSEAVNLILSTDQTCFFINDCSTVGVWEGSTFSGREINKGFNTEYRICVMDSQSGSSC